DRQRQGFLSSSRPSPAPLRLFCSDFRVTRPLDWPTGTGWTHPVFRSFSREVRIADAGLGDDPWRGVASRCWFGRGLWLGQQFFVAFGQGLGGKVCISD